MNELTNTEKIELLRILVPYLPMIEESYLATTIKPLISVLVISLYPNNPNPKEK